MDGFESNPGVIVLAATNRPEILDDALKRPGRFDRQITVNLPSIKGREDILKIHTKKMPLASDVDIKVLARRTQNFAGANLKNLCNEAAISAVRLKKNLISMQDFEVAMDKILMGLENKSLLVSEDEKLKTAYHEAGHTIINKMFVDELDPLHKVSISPRGRSLGVTMTLPKGEVLNYTKTKCEKMIAMLMGGRVAEKLIYNQETTGASDDINKATQIATSMVYSWGMSEMGPLNFANDNTHGNNKFSEKVRSQADEVVSMFVKTQEELATKILSTHREALDALAKALLEKETLDSKEVDAILNPLIPELIPNV